MNELDDAKVIDAISLAIRDQFPNAQAGDAVVLKLGEADFHATVGEGCSFFGQTKEQLQATYQLSQTEYEDLAFKVQLEFAGHPRHQADYLDISEDFIHPLAEMSDDGEFMNLYALATMIVNGGYLKPSLTDDSGAKAIKGLKDLLGDGLTSEIEQQLRDRHKPTIYHVCTQIVEIFTQQIQGK